MRRLLFFLFALAISAVIAEPSRFKVLDSNGNPCIIATMNVSFVIPYNVSDGKVSNASLVMPSTGVSSNNSVCSIHQVNLLLSWSESYKLQFEFQKVDKNTSWKVSGIKFTYNTNNSSVFINSTDVGIKTISHIDPLFKTKMDVAYLCNKDTLIVFDNSHSVMIIDELKLQAYKFSGTDFSSEVNECSNDSGGGAKKPEKKDITVPIAVGATLGVLIVILIIAYFVGKRSSREYQSI